MSDLSVRFPRSCEAQWEAMASSGCDRVCAQCDTLIHDLSNYEFDEVEGLLRSDPGACVRARVDADGVVALKLGRSGRRMVVATGTMAALLAACQPATPGGDIAGRITDRTAWGDNMQVTATGSDGKQFSAKVRADGTYRITHVPSGTYSLTFDGECGADWIVENVMVAQSDISAPDSKDASGCYTLGQMMIADPSHTG